MSKWIKENLVLVAGILLPVLLVAGFFVLNKAPRILTDPPEYDFLLVAYRNDYQHPREFHLGFEVRDGQLRGKVTPVNDEHSHLNRQYAGIFRYHAAANRFEEIVYELPEGLDELEEVLEFTVAETRQLELDRRSKSPDGFISALNSCPGCLKCDLSTNDMRTAAPGSVCWRPSRVCTCGLLR